VAISLGLVVLAVILQTTVFTTGRIQPLGAAPNLVLLVVVACARYLDAEPALLVAFTAGLLMDLLAGSPLGLWAISLTVVAYLTYRMKRRAEDGAVWIVVGVFALTVIGQFLYVLLATLFGQNALGDPELIRKIFLPAAYNVILVAPVFWAVRALLRPKERSWAL
jgi:rod shape-determining protein MreD